MKKYSLGAFSPEHLLKVCPKEFQKRGCTVYRVGKELWASSGPLTTAVWLLMFFTQQSQCQLTILSQGEAL